MTEQIGVDIFIAFLLTFVIYVAFELAIEHSG